MTDYSYSEFEQDLPDLWEVDFRIDRRGFHYERDYISRDGTWRFWLAGPKGALVFDEVVDSQDGMVEKVLGLEVCEGKTIAELWDRLEITNMI